MPPDDDTLGLCFDPAEGLYFAPRRRREIGELYFDPSTMQITEGLIVSRNDPTYQPRDTSPERRAVIDAQAELHATLEREAAAGERTWDYMTDEVRKRTCFDLSTCEHTERMTLDFVEVCTNCGQAVGGLKPKEGCNHTSGTLYEVHNPHGIWGIILCAQDDCGGVQAGPECPHLSNTWDEPDGRVLTCDNCGIDGT